MLIIRYCIFDKRLKEDKGKCIKCKADIDIKHEIQNDVSQFKKSPKNSPVKSQSPAKPQRKSPIKRKRARVEEMDSETTTEEEASEPEYESESDD